MCRAFIIPIVTQPQRSMSTTKIVLIVVGSVLAVCCAGGAVAAYFGVRAFSGAIGPPSAVTESFIRDLESGNSASAYGKLCAPTRQRISQDRFAEMVGERRPSSFRIVETSVRNMNGRVSATVTASLTYPDGFTDTHAFHLQQERGEWKVCGDPY